MILESSANVTNVKPLAEAIVGINARPEIIEMSVRSAHDRDHGLKGR